MSTDLVVLAGGLARRFGGDKQTAAVDERGQTLIDYAFFDAYRAGIRRAVLVIREEDQAKLTPLTERWKDKMALAFCPQTPPAAYGFERVKPLGTGHALLCAADKVKGGFLLVNADDYYGREAIGLAVSCAEEGENAVIAYPLGGTVPPTGKVSRGVLVTSEGNLKGIVECEVRREGKRIGANDGKVKRYLPPSTPVSLNLFAFTQGIFSSAGRVFGNFLLSSGDDDECLLARVVGDHLSRGGRVAVVETTERWIGMTRREDMEGVKGYLAAKVQAGEYPLDLAKEV